MKKRAIIGLAVALVAMAWVSGGCGGGDDTTESLTKEEFVKQSGAICGETKARMEAEYRARRDAQKEAVEDSQVREKLFRESFVEPYREMVAEIEELGTPKGDEQELESIFSEWRKAGELFEEDPLLLLTEPPTFDKVNELSKEYGLTEDCIF